MEKSEVQMMIDLAISRYDGVAAQRLTKIEERIIGIDSNGSGRAPGALQRQDIKLAELDKGQAYMIEQLHDIQRSAKTWDKATFYRNAKAWIMVFLALFGAVIGYLTYRAHVGKEVTQIPHAQVMPYNAGN